MDKGLVALHAGHARHEPDLPLHRHAEPTGAADGHAETGVEAETQEKSILYHENTYIQNSGMDFGLTDTFDVVAVLDGSVTDVKEDETLGKVVEIKHDNGYVSIYQSLSEVSVKKGDIITQGQVIGKSGTNELDKDIGNHLHFELYVNGQVVDPTLYLNKELETSENKE